MVLGNSLLKYPNLSFSSFGTLQKSLGAGRDYGRVITRRLHRPTLPRQDWWRCPSKIIRPSQILWELSKVVERSSTIKLIRLLLLNNLHHFCETHLGLQLCTNTKTNTIQIQTHLGWQIPRWYWALHGWCWKQTSLMTFSLWMIKR